MEKLEQKKILIILINKRKISYFKKSISEDIKTIKDLNDYVKKKDWIEKYIVDKKPLFLYINSAKILKADQLIENCKKDIMLLIYHNVNYITQNYSDSIYSLSQSIIDNFTNGDIPIGYNLLPNSFSSIANNNTSFSFLNLDINNSSENTIIDNSTQINQSITSTSSISGMSSITSTSMITGTSSITSVSNINNQINDLTSESETEEINDNDVSDIVSENNQNLLESTSNIINLLQNSLLSTNIFGDTGITSLVNTTNNTNNQTNNTVEVSYDLDHIRELYSEEYRFMLSLGFTDINRILQALFVCEGNIENATNYYLSQ